MPVDVTLIVTDAPPLITLAVARSLDYLLYPELPVIIPDAVFYEATSASGKLGAQDSRDYGDGGDYGVGIGLGLRYFSSSIASSCACPGGPCVTCESGPAGGLPDLG